MGLVAKEDSRPQVVWLRRGLVEVESELAQEHYIS